MDPPKPETTLAQDWTVVFNNIQWTAVIAMTLFAVVAIVVTWQRTRSFAPTAAVILAGAVAVFLTDRSAYVKDLVDDQVSDSKTGVDLLPPEYGGGDDEPPNYDTPVPDFDWDLNE